MAEDTLINIHTCNSNKYLLTGMHKNTKEELLVEMDRRETFFLSVILCVLISKGKKGKERKKGR